MRGTVCGMDEPEGIRSVLECGSIVGLDFKLLRQSDLVESSV